MAQWVKNPPAMQEIQEMWVWSIGREDPPEEEIATHASILAWKIPWKGEHDGLQSRGSQRVGHDWASKASKHVYIFKYCCCCSFAQLCTILCDPMDYSTPVFLVLHYLPEFAQRVRWVGDAIQPSHPLSSPSSALNLSQNEGLSQWFSPSHQELQHQSFQWIFRVDFL